MIELVAIDGHYFPKIFCDSCREEILDSKQAAVVYSNLIEGRPKVDMSYVHKDFVKGDCLTKAEEIVRSSGEEPGWMELGKSLAYLISNVGLSSEDIQERLEVPDL